MKIIQIATKTLLLITVSVLVFFLSSVVIPDKYIIIHSTLPEGNINFKLQNRIIVIVFFLVLLLITKKRYMYIFDFAPFKKRDTYFWILGVLLLNYFFLQTIDGFINFGSFRFLPLSLTQYLQFIFILSIIVPIEEELLYRGLLILIPSKRIKYLMLFISSLLFAFIHAEPTFQFFLGLGLGILAIRFNNILVPIFAHSLWNLFNSFFNF